MAWPLKLNINTKSITFTKTITKTKILAVIFSFSTLPNACIMGHVYILYYESLTVYCIVL